MNNLFPHRIGETLQSWIGIAPKWLRNFYVITGFFFALWMLFFDLNNLTARWQQLDDFERLKEERLYYQAELERLKQERKALRSDNEALEKFAREKYFFRKDGEHVYLID